MSAAECVAARQLAEDTIGLDDYYRIERETVERGHATKKQGRRK
jgi:hypothetical protein